MTTRPISRTCSQAYGVTPAAYPIYFTRLLRLQRDNACGRHPLGVLLDFTFYSRRH